jgi:translation initiation factor IF-3
MGGAKRSHHTSQGHSIRINNDIRSPTVRLIDYTGAQQGIFSLAEALQLTESTEAQMQKRLDLVEIAPLADPPVCQMVEYSKYIFELNKKKSLHKKKQKQVKLKEVKFRPGTEKNDYEVKLRHIITFLKVDARVKISIRFRGREMEHNEFGVDLMRRLENDLVLYGTIESSPKTEGRQMIMVVAPKKQKNLDK